MSKTANVIWLLISLIWIGAWAAYAFLNWPHMSLDISRVDEGTIKAYDQAVTAYLLRCAAAALIPPSLIYFALRILKR